MFARPPGASYKKKFPPASWRCRYSEHYSVNLCKYFKCWLTPTTSPPMQIWWIFVNISNVDWLPTSWRSTPWRACSMWCQTEEQKWFSLKMFLVSDKYLIGLSSSPNLKLRLPYDSELFKYVIQFPSVIVLKIYHII